MPRLHAVRDTPPRAVIYLRQSTQRDDSISLELQELACREYAERMGYEVITVEADPGISGRTWKRPAVQRSMQMVEDGAADIIVLWKWSRLSRSRKDWALAIDRCDVAGGRIESATEPIDTATASGRFARGVMTEYAAFQSEQIGEVWEEVRQRRLKAGKPASGRLPFGWIWAKDGIRPDPERSEIVVEMYRRYLAGDGAASIARWLNARGVPAPNGGAWARARPLTVMDSPIHAGLIPYRGATYPGDHEPIIDRETWDEYTRERTRRGALQAKPRPADHLLSGLVRCWCGARMYGKGSVTGGRWYGGYLCSLTLANHDGRAYISALALEPVIVDWLMTFTPTPPDRRDTAVQANRDRLNRDLSDLETELAALTRQHLKGIVSEIAYARTSADLHQEITDSQDELRRLRSQDRAVPSPEQIVSLRRAWPVMTVEAKNLALRQMVERIELGSPTRIRTTWGDSSEVTA